MRFIDIRKMWDKVRRLLAPRLLQPQPVAVRTRPRR
jgi:hypothetical protein